MPIDKNLADQADDEQIKCNQKWLKDSDADLIVEILKRGKVKKMMLTSNDLGEEAAHKIATALLDNTSLHWLSLASNQFTDVGGALFADVIEKNEVLETLFLVGNQMTVTACDKLWEANQKRTKPMTENLFGLVLDHKSPAGRATDAEKAAEKKKKKPRARAG